MNKINSKVVVKRIWTNAVVSIAVTSFMAYLIVSFAELSGNVANWHEISRGILGLCVFGTFAWSISHAAGMINVHRKQMEELKRQMNEMEIRKESNQ